MKQNNRSVKSPGFRVIYASAATLAGFLGKNPRRPGAKGIHKLRTSARKLGNIVTAFSARDGGHNSLLRNLDDVRKYAGDIRNMDVLTAHTLTLERGKEKRCLVQLLEALGAERFKRARKLHRLIKSDGAEFLKRLKRYLAHLKKLQAHTEANNSETERIMLAAARAKMLSSEIQSPIRLSRGNLHEVRIKVKELSDLLEISTIPTQEVDPLRKTLGPAKDAIGIWHDWETLTVIARSSIDHGRSCSVIQTIQKTSQSKYRLALREARKLQVTVSKRSA